MIDRERVRAIVREELLRRLDDADSLFHPALVEIVREELDRCLDDSGLPETRACVIEPGRPCYNSGYCKKLGY